MESVSFIDKSLGFGCGGLWVVWELSLVVGLVGHSGFDS